ncbi:hypothetical protein SAPIO_CDS3873 [Scedosporium apiospermum]|uniref:DASH complex subunit SPC34 n=1 Tax=Pseudallescheria apiosperma TaxID=563466 RepID=A0A084G9U4_PSEDA|nr:uncharacterized protein SAPIO_CDS3873 [Scedosporium apiospermum]KEZ44106.1 hypothetical protein SAPIO_CDS3873 [Scedosporium apiospermum]
MSLLSAHLEQIAYSCEGIDSLPFPPPKIFTNALLSSHDITTLLRDTEPHERALFSVPPPPPPPTKPAPEETSTRSSRRQTVFNVSSGEVTTGGPPTRASARRNTAVAAVLGAPMHERLRRAELSSSSRDDVDIEVLLRGAETLCGVYELPGARRRIAELRGREADLRGTMEYYEGRVREQGEALEAMSKDWREGEEEEEEEEEEDVWTEEGLRGEEEEVRELEGRKRELQERLRAMERDLGGLMNM